MCIPTSPRASQSMSFAEVGLKGRYAEGLFNAEHSTAECLWKCRWIYGRGICYTITLSHLRFFLHFTPSLHAAFAHVCSRLLTLAHANYVLFRAFTYLLGPLHVPFRALLTFAHACSRISSSWSIHVLFRAWDLKKVHGSTWHQGVPFRASDLKKYIMTFGGYVAFRASFRGNS